MKPTTKYNDPIEQEDMYQHPPIKLSSIKEQITSPLPTEKGIKHKYILLLPKEKYETLMNQVDITVKPNHYINNFIGTTKDQVMFHEMTKPSINRGIKPFSVSSVISVPARPK